MFKAKSMNYYHIINEAIISSFYCAILVDAVNKKDVISEKVSFICIYITIAAWGLNIAKGVITNLYITIQKIKRFIATIKKRKIDEVYKDMVTVKTIHETKFDENDK